MDKVKKFLIIGGDSKLGIKLSHGLESLGHGKYSIFKTSRREVLGRNTYYMDLELPNLPEQNFDVVYIVAAVTKVVDCEAFPEKSWRVNADAPVILTMAAHSRGVHTVFISSDAVERAPHLAYSKQKTYAETIILSLGGTIVRPSRIPENASSLIDLLIQVGVHKMKGLYRWSE